MKILYLIHDTVISGAALSLFNLLEGLDSKGVKIHIAGPNPTDSYIARLRSIGAQYHVLHPALSIMPPHKTLRNIAGFPKNLFMLLRRKKRYYLELEKLIKLIQPDIIHSNVGIIHEGMALANRYKIPHVIHLREYQDKDFNWDIFPSKRRFEEMLKNTNVICISEDIKRYFDLCDYCNCRTIYNGILYKRDATYNSQKQNYFMTASRISPEKDIAMTIKAFSIFSQQYKNYVLRVFGDGAEIYKNELKVLCNVLGLENKVIFEGYKSNIPDYLGQATALIVSSCNEGFGRMSAEALMKGCALIGRNSGGTKEIMGAVPSFPFEDETECASQMIHVVNLLQNGMDSHLLKSQKKAVNLFSVEQNVDNVYNFYNDIISHH